MNFYNEMYDAAGGVRPHYQGYADWLKATPMERIERKRAESRPGLSPRRDHLCRVWGGGGQGAPDPVRHHSARHSIAEWKALQAGLRQRVKALNMFLWDVYHDQEILKAGIIPAEQVLNNAQYRPIMQASMCRAGSTRTSPASISCAPASEFYVLEDNLRVPSGVSYMLEDRKMMMRCSGAVRQTQGGAGAALSGPVAGKSCGRRRRGANPPVVVLTRGPTTAPISNIPSWPSRWASNWSRGVICSSRTRWSTCARRRGRNVSM